MPINREQLMGMTTNERLYEVGKLDQFDVAVAAGDWTRIREILESIFVDEPSIRITEESRSRGGQR